MQLYGEHDVKKIFFSTPISSVMSFCFTNQVTFRYYPKIIN